MSAETRPRKPSELTGSGGTRAQPIDSRAVAYRSSGMSHHLRLRPFREFVERAPGQPVFEIAGRIDGDRFLVSAIGYEVALDTAAAGSDERGAFALVRECERPLAAGFKVRVELEPDPVLPHGAALMIYLEGEARERARELLRARGIDADSVVLLAPYESAFSVSFNSLGLVDGRSASIVVGRDAVKPGIH